MTTSDIDSELVRRLAQLLDETGLTELEYATDSWRVRVARHPGGSQNSQRAGATAASAPSPEPASGPAAIAEPPPDASHPGAVVSPMVGTVYLAPEPDAAPFVATGANVKKGDTLLIIEAMKVMNPVLAPRAGRVARILVENGAPVEYGAVLLILE